MQRQKVPKVYWTINMCVNVTGLRHLPDRKRKRYTHSLNIFHRPTPVSSGQTLWRPNAYIKKLLFFSNIII